MCTIMARVVGVLAEQNDAPLVAPHTAPTTAPMAFLDVAFLDVARIYSGAQSVHLEFPPRPNRLGIQVEVVLLNNLCSLEIALQDFGEHFDDQLHVVPGNPAETTKFMLEGLM